MSFTFVLPSKVVVLLDESGSNECVSYNFPGTDTHAKHVAHGGTDLSTHDHHISFASTKCPTDAIAVDPLG